MNLKEFITETISAIADATTELQTKYSAEEILINPPTAQSGSDVYQPDGENYTMRRVQSIAFDVAVTAASETGKGGKAQIKVLSLELGGSAEKRVNSEQISRVKFEVPMTLKPSNVESQNRAKKAETNRRASMPMPPRQNLGSGLRS